MLLSIVNVYFQVRHGLKIVPFRQIPFVCQRSVEKIGRDFISFFMLFLLETGKILPKFKK